MRPSSQSVEFLIVDDDAPLSGFFRAYLESKGHSCSAITDASGAIPWLQANHCAVAIIDLKMPKIDGISLVSLVREFDSALPVIVLTGAGFDEGQMHAALRAGANGYVSKNLPVEQLYRVLSRILGTTRHPAQGELLGAA
jgi:DNA-binding response OmpR family regulator